MVTKKLTLVSLGLIISHLIFHLSELVLTGRFNDYLSTDELSLSCHNRSSGILLHDLKHKTLSVLLYSKLRFNFSSPHIQSTPSRSVTKDADLAVYLD